MLKKHWENRKDLEVIIDVAVTAGYLIAKEQIEVGDSRDLIDAAIEIAEAFEVKFKDFDWNDQPEGTFKSYVMEIDEFAEKELLKKYRKEEELISYKECRAYIEREASIYCCSVCSTVYSSPDELREGRCPACWEEFTAPLTCPGNEKE